ncbi:MAG: hypothetical protein WAN33_04015 [Candidatus Acidiferrales bacterium]
MGDGDSGGSAARVHLRKKPKWAVRSFSEPEEVHTEIPPQKSRTPMRDGEDTVSPAKEPFAPKAKFETLESSARSAFSRVKAPAVLPAEVTAKFIPPKVAELGRVPDKSKDTASALAGEAKQIKVNKKATSAMPAKVAFFISPCLPGLQIAAKRVCTAAKNGLRARGEPA